MVRTIERMERDFDVQHCFIVYDARSDRRQYTETERHCWKQLSNLYLND